MNAAAAPQGKDLGRETVKIANLEVPVPLPVPFSFPHSFRIPLPIGGIGINQGPASLMSLTWHVRSSFQSARQTCFLKYLS